MANPKKIENKKVCPKGHLFYKSSDCLVCPVCEQVTIDPVIPDQAIRTQQTERARHLVAIEVTLLGHRLFQCANTGFVDKDINIARVSEIGQRREQRPVRHRHLVDTETLVGPGHISTDQRATDAASL